MALTLDRALGQLDISCSAFRRIDDMDSMPRAALPGQVHFIAVLSGAGRLDGLAEPMQLAPGQLLLLPADMQPVSVAQLVVAHGVLGAALLDGRSLFDFLSLPHRLDASGTELFTGAIPELLRESAYGGPGSEAIITCLARRLMTTLVRDAWPQASDIAAPGEVTRQQRLNKIVELLRKDPGREFTLDGLASAAAMSRTVFHREFVAAYGSSPLTMLRSLRLERAARLLGQTEMPINIIANRLGYRSRSHFSKLFKETHGVDPEQFRALQKSA